jgi:hypothetical protein
LDIPIIRLSDPSATRRCSAAGGTEAACLDVEIPQQCLASLNNNNNNNNNNNKQKEIKEGLIKDKSLD